MADAVRQPIDIPSLERYLNQDVPEIKTPLEVKQVSCIFKISGNRLMENYSSASASRILRTRSLPPIKSDTFCARSRRASCSPRRPTRSSVNTRLSMRWGRPMCRFQGRIVYAKMAMLLGRRSTSWSFWTGACLPIRLCLK